MKHREQATVEPLLDIGLDRVHLPPGARVTVSAIDEARILREELHLQLEHLRRERERSSFLFDAAPFACLATDTAGRISEANRCAAELFGRPARRLVGARVEALAAEGWRDDLRERLRAVVQADEDGWQRWTSVIEPYGKALRVTINVRLARAAAPSSRVFWIVRERRTRAAPKPER